MHFLPTGDRTGPADEHEISTALARLLVSRHGFLSRSPLADPMLRAALLADWMVSGRLSETATELSIDTSPTPNPAANALLERIAAEPGYLLADWLADDQGTFALFIGHLVASGLLLRCRSVLVPRYRDRFGLEPRRRLTARLSGVIYERRHETPAVIALAALADLLGLLRPGFVDLTTTNPAGGSESRHALGDVSAVDRAGPLRDLLDETQDWAIAQLLRIRAQSTVNIVPFNPM